MVDEEEEEKEEEKEEEEEKKKKGVVGEEEEEVQEEVEEGKGCVWMKASDKTRKESGGRWAVDGEWVGEGQRGIFVFSRTAAV